MRFVAVHPHVETWIKIIDIACTPRNKNRPHGGSWHLRRRCVILFGLMISLSFAGQARAEFWFEDFTDGRLNAFETDWWYLEEHSIASDGLLLSTNTSERPTVAAPDWPADRQGWSVRTQGRLLQDHGFFGPATGANPGATSADDTWSLVSAVGNARMGNGTNVMSDLVATDLRPFEEDVIVQLETFDGVMRMWAWREGGKPTEDIAPLVEMDFELPDAAPGIWARSNDGPSSTLFRWLAISTEHMPVHMPVPRNDLVGDIDADGEVVFADFLVLSTNFGTEVDPPGINGDLNRNGEVDFPDFLILSEHFGRVEGAVAPVPEPTGLALSLCAASLLGLTSRRRGPIRIAN